ncbi:oxygenase MpaB family protein [Nocardioides stalactiti]|uniref:oxygenase MpaB family protein n=1 Tax=Nocardioides stalactiti TaxID=2755356 RepID=UPI001601C7B1|nr:oxygenase MpaB family protein [Nocardioides stalactiti]
MSGYFAPDSMVVKALSARAVGLTYGQRALALGALKSDLFVGTAQHTTHRQSPYTRLGLTARLFEAVFLGTKEEADRALAFTAKRHATVRGTMGVDGGPAYPVGSTYSAADPRSMWWTAAFTLDSVEFMYDALVRRLKDREREELFEGFVAWAELFGMPRSGAPSTYAEHRATYDAWLVSDEPFLTDEARLIGRHLAGTSGYALPFRPVSSPALATVVQGSLPPVAREHYGIPWGIRDEASWQAVSRASRLAHGGVPLLARTPLLSGRSAEFYKVVQRGEKKLLSRGGVSIPGVSDVDPPYGPLSVSA